jgi:hypothetical protein
MKELETYTVRVSFDENNNDPFVILLALSDIVKGFKLINEAVASTIHNEVEIVSYLIDIEKGSILVKFRDALKNVPDDLIINSIKNPKHFIAVAAVKAKRATISALDGVENCDSKTQQWKVIISNVKHALSNSGITISNPLNEEKLLYAASEIAKGVRKLPKNKVEFIDIDGTQSIKGNFEWIEDKAVTKILPANEITARVKIKKAIYAGDAQWTVTYNKDIAVSILDNKWLEQYQTAQISVPPGSWLKVRMHEVIELSEDDKIIGEPKYYILEVLEVIVPETLFS